MIIPIDQGATSIQQLSLTMNSFQLTFRHLVDANNVLAEPPPLHPAPSSIPPTSSCSSGPTPASSSSSGPLDQLPLPPVPVDL